MKQPMTSILKMFSLALLLASGTACTDNFDKINSKDYQVTKQEQERENYNLGTTLRGLQGLVIPTQEHSYQFIESISRRSICWITSVLSIRGQPNLKPTTHL